MNQNSAMLQLVEYFVVGLLATFVEWIAFYFLGNCFRINYLLATAIAFIFSTFANWAFGRVILFKGTGNAAMEILKIYGVSVIGLLMNLAIMFLMVEIWSVKKMLSKVVATAIVFLWNFLIRKLFIYKNKAE